MTQPPPANAGGQPWYRRFVTSAAGSLRTVFGRDSMEELVADRERLSGELTRRLGELYSLQELAHVLSASLRFDRVVVEVARYAMRALDASGAVVLLAPEHGGDFEVVAAKGVLAPHVDRRIDPEAGGLLQDAIAHERVVLRTAGAAPVRLFESAGARTALAAPLRAHGVTVGAILVADKLVGDFTADDARLLSTAATHAAVVLTNARFFELVRVGKEQWEGTFDALAEGLAMVDAAGSVRRANAAMADLMRVPVASVVGRPLAQALFGDQRALEPQLAAARAGQRPAAVMRRSEPLGRYLRVAVAPLAKAAADAVAVVVVEDITDQKALESQLMQSEKLATVGTLVSGVAHELNNPLTSVAGLSEFLLERGTGDDTAREHLRVINDQAERASRIVRNLLSFARKSPAERTAVDLGDVAQRTLLLLGYELGRAGIVVETVIEPGLPAVGGNRDELQQVLLNLLTNAAYALQQVAADAPRRLTVHVAAEADRVVLRVSDTGPGIPREALGQIFDPFFTTKPPGEGTGLGLFLAYGIAEAHGGSLTAESAPGEGATFALTLPRFEPPDEAAAKEPGAPRRRVLVVDDDTAMRRLAAVFFAHEGYDVDEATDGTEALTLARGTDYDLVLADRHAGTGAEPLLSALARERPNWRGRLIVTGTGAPGPDGAGHFLQKPFSSRDLRAAAAEVRVSPL